MKLIFGFLMSASVLFFFGCGGSATNGKADGKTIYEANCTKCHGDDGKAGIMGAADLSASKLDKAMMTTIIKEGKGVMAGFGDVLNDEQVNAVIEFVNTLKK